MKKVVKPGIYLHIFPSKKFKTSHLSVHLMSMLDEEKMASYALLSNLLTTSSQKYPTKQSLKQKLAYLYGSYLSSSVSSFGEYQLLNIYLSQPADEYLTHGVAEESLALLEEVLFHPLAENGAFDQKIFDHERKNLLDDVASLYNYKQAFAAQKTNEAYFEPVRHQKMLSGDASDIKSLTPERVYQTYQSMLSSDEIHICVIGNVNEDELVRIFSEWDLPEREDLANDMTYYQQPRERVQSQSLRQEVQQAKLNLVYGLKERISKEEMTVFAVLNDLLGGSMHSKLFQNVREEANLAYDVSSGFDFMRSRLLVQSGIDATHKEQAIKIIEEQVKAIKDGDISDQELDWTKKSLVNKSRQRYDNPYHLISVILSDELLEISSDLEDKIGKIEAVTVRDIQKAADLLTLDTIFSLEGNA